jgi:hypothetical protein
MRSASTLLLAALIVCPAAYATPKSATAGAMVPQPKITVLYDAFGKVPGLQKDWGYSALIEGAWSTS